MVKRCFTFGAIMLLISVTFIGCTPKAAPTSGSTKTSVPTPTNVPIPMLESPKLEPATGPWNLVGTRVSGGWARFEYIRNVGQEGDVLIQAYLESPASSTTPVERTFHVKENREYKLTVVVAGALSATESGWITLVIESPSGLHVNSKLPRFMSTVKISSIELEELPK